MTLLVHAVGQSDLLLAQLRHDGAPGELDWGSAMRESAERIRARRAELAAALDTDPGSTAAAGLLVEGAWPDGHGHTSLPTPLLAALRTLATSPGAADAPIDVVVLGTSHGDPRDTLELAELLVRALERGLADHVGVHVRHAAAVPVAGMAESHVVVALAERLSDVPEDAAVTWGAGPGALQLGAMTALSHAGVPWRLVLVGDGDDKPHLVADALEDLTVDPTIGVLVRWRLFDALVQFASGENPIVQLTDAQRALVQAAAQRRRDGFEICDSVSMRAVVADAIVRRDGTAAMAVRRYIVSKYEKLLDLDRITHPDAENLLKLLEWRDKGGPSLGPKIGEIERALAGTSGDQNPCRDKKPWKLRKGGSRECIEEKIRASRGLKSCDWLVNNPIVKIFNSIGKCSHRLQKPNVEDARAAAEHLARWDVDGYGWARARLPVPPLVPGDTTLAVWCVGNLRQDGRPSVGQQLATGRLPRPVREYLDVDRDRVAALVFGTDHPISRDGAQADVEHLLASEQVARFQPIDDLGGDPGAVESAIEDLIKPGVGALLLVPTGPKPVVSTLLRAMRRLGARYGLPLFVRQNANPRGGDWSRAEAYLWPALTGGDLPLLLAAREALLALELDVAWRLLAASAIRSEVTDRVRWLAMAFASRDPDDDDQWQTSADVAVPGDRIGRTRGLVAQRMRLVQATLSDASNPDPAAPTPAERTRLMVLAADVLESSIAAAEPDQPGQKPGARYGRFREKLNNTASGKDANAESARILLLLNAARDQSSITHGIEGDPDLVVAEEARKLSDGWPPAADELPHDVDTLVSQAIEAALAQGLGSPDRVDDLVKLRDFLVRAVSEEIHQRQTRAAAFIGRGKENDAASS